MNLNAIESYDDDCQEYMEKKYQAEGSFGWFWQGMPFPLILKMPWFLVQLRNDWILVCHGMIWYFQPWDSSNTSVWRDVNPMVGSMVERRCWISENEDDRRTSIQKYLKNKWVDFLDREVVVSIYVYIYTFITSHCKILVLKPNPIISCRSMAFEPPVRL